MSLIVEVYVGSHLSKEHRKLVATGVVHNISNLADISNYEGVVQEVSSASLRIPAMSKPLKIVNHNRQQSVWSLVQKIVEGALDG